MIFSLPRGWPGVRFPAIRQPRRVCAAAERLAIAEAARRERAISEFAVQELLRFIEAGIAIPEPTRAALQALIERQEIQQHSRTLHHALHRLLTRPPQGNPALSHTLRLLRLVQETDQNA